MESFRQMECDICGRTRGAPCVDRGPGGLERVCPGCQRQTLGRETLVRWTRQPDAALSAEAGRDYAALLFEINATHPSARCGPAPPVTMDPARLLRLVRMGAVGWSERGVTTTAHWSGRRSTTAVYGWAGIRRVLYRALWGEPGAPFLSDQRTADFLCGLAEADFPVRALAADWVAWEVGSVAAGVVAAALGRRPGRGPRPGGYGCRHLLEHAPQEAVAKFRKAYAVSSDSADYRAVRVAAARAVLEWGGLRRAWVGAVVRRAGSAGQVRAGPRDAR